MPRVRTRSSSVTTTDENGNAVNVTTDWVDVSEAVAAKIAHLVEVEDAINDPPPAPEPESPEHERPFRRSRKE